MRPAVCRFLQHPVQPAVNTPTAVGWTDRQIHVDADRRYGQWLIDNAGK
ncbi:hypothetical protein [Streptomyces sp. NPDC057690]